jgi:hypothetical protein
MMADFQEMEGWKMANAEVIVGYAPGIQYYSVITGNDSAGWNPENYRVNSDEITE